MGWLEKRYICGYKGVLMRRLVRFYEDWIKDWFIDCDHKFELRHKRGDIDYGVYT